jgi:hypothetical protein
MSQTVKNIIAFVVGAVIVILLSRWHGCDPPRYIGNDTLGTSQKIDSFIKHDTVFIDTNSRPQPVKYIDTGRVVHDTIPAKPTAGDTAAILADHYSTYVYDDSIPTKYGGYAKIRDTVSENRITGRGFSLFQDIPEKTITIKTTTVVKERKPIGYLGVTGAYPFGIGVQAGVKLKNDQYITGGVELFQGQTIFKGSVNFPIRLKRK